MPVYQIPTINLIESDAEEEMHSSMPVIEEFTQPLQTFADLFSDNGVEDSIPHPKILETTFSPVSSTAALLLSHIHTLSTFPVGVTPSSSLS